MFRTVSCFVKLLKNTKLSTLSRSEWLGCVLVAALLLSLSCLLPTTTTSSVSSIQKILWSSANLLAGLCVYYSGNSSGDTLMLATLF